jgi:hypothetical protein
METALLEVPSCGQGEICMCRNIKTLFNFEPPATEDEIRASALQFVRKLSGFNKPSKANEEAFDRAIEQVTAVARELIASLVTNAEPRDREIEAERARQRNAERYGTA